MDWEKACEEAHQRADYWQGQAKALQMRRDELMAVAGLICALHAWKLWKAVRYAYRDAETRAHWRDWDWGG